MTQHWINSVLLLGILFFNGSCSAFEFDAQNLNSLGDEFNADLEQLFLTQTQKEALKLQLAHLKTIKFPSCPYFNAAKNTTIYMKEIQRCNEIFGFEGLEWDEIPSDEYTESICDKEKRKKFMECVQPPPQNFILALLRCSVGQDWNEDSKVYETFQYILLTSIPRLVDSFVKFTCSNQEILRVWSELEFGERDVALLKTADPNPAVMGGTVIVFCLKKYNPELLTARKSTCQHFASLDLSNTFKCATEMINFNDPRIHDIYKKSFHLVELFFEKTEGLERKEWVKTLWDTFCSEESPLSKMFNHRKTTFAGTEDEEITMEEKKQRTLKAFGEAGNGFWDAHTLGYHEKCSFEDEKIRERIEMDMADMAVYSDYGIIPRLTQEINQHLAQRSGNFCLIGDNLQCSPDGVCDCRRTFILGMTPFVKSVRENDSCRLTVGSACVPHNVRIKYPEFKEFNSVRNFFLPLTFDCQSQSTCVTKSDGTPCTVEKLQSSLLEDFDGDPLNDYTEFQSHMVHKLHSGLCICSEIHPRGNVVNSDNSPLKMQRTEL